jgi:PBP1b-binding outer membrane lipoprotein LpoB
LAKHNQMIAPDLSMTGKILQNIQRLGDGSQRIDYQFQLSMTDVHTGLALWEDVEPVSKLTSGRTVTW